MASYFVSAHGNLRKEGNRKTMPKFIVPPSATIYFYTPPRSVMWARESDIIMDLLVCPDFFIQDELTVREQALEVFKEGDLCLNYTANTDGPSFRDPCGVYLVGNSAEKKPMLPIPPGTSKTLQQIVSGIGGGQGAAFGNHFYWCCCRVHDIDNQAVSKRNFQGFAFSGASLQPILLPGQSQPTSMGSSDRTLRINMLDQIEFADDPKQSYRNKLKKLFANIKKTGGLFAD